MSRVPRIVAIVVVGSLLFAACGGSDSGGSDGGGGGASVADGGGPDNAFDVAECAQAAAAMAAAMSAVPSMMSGAAVDVQTSLDQLQTFAAQAPDEIKDDLATVAAGYSTFVQALKDSGYDPTSGEAPSAEAIAAMQTASAALDSAEFKAASDNVSTWFQQNCGG